MKVIIWSKSQCSYCEQSKLLLQSKGIEFEERVVGEGWSKDQLLEAVPNARTVPQIFINDVLIGGYYELRTQLQG